MLRDGFLKVATEEMAKEARQVLLEAPKPLLATILTSCIQGLCDKSREGAAVRGLPRGTGAVGSVGHEGEQPQRSAGRCRGWVSATRIAPRRRLRVREVGDLVPLQARHGQGVDLLLRQELQEHLLAVPERVDANVCSCSTQEGGPCGSHGRGARA